MTRPSRSWLDLYVHGENLMMLCKAFRTKFQNAEEEDNTNMMIQWGEALRKTTMNCQDIAKTVLGVEELVKGKTVIRA